MKAIAPLAALLATVLLGGCATAPSGPSVMALPGTGKNFEEFRRDDESCRQFAIGRSGGDPDAGVRSAAVGTVVGAIAGAAIGGQQGAGVGAGTGLIVGSMAGAGAAQGSAIASQRQYDNAYVQCMYGKGQRVPVPAALAGRQSRPPPPSPTPPASYFPPPPPGSPPPR